MHRLFFVCFWLGVLVFVGSCTRKTMDCSFCGTYEFVNFTKSEKSFFGPDQTSIRRSLNVQTSIGNEYFTFWSDHPEKKTSDVQQLVKEVQFPQRIFSIESDGTWQLKLKVIETFFEENDQNEQAKWSVERKITESGTWSFLNRNEQYLNIQRDLSIVENEIHVSDYLPKNFPEADYPFHTRKYHEGTQRQFEVQFDTFSNELVLSSLVEDDSVYNKSLHTASYSICEGNVYLTCQPNQSGRQFVQNLHD